MNNFNIPQTIINLLKVHLEPMAAHAKKSSTNAAGRQRDGIAILVASGGSAYANFTRAHPEFAGETIVVVEWYRPEGHDDDALSVGPRVSTLPRTTSPIEQHILTLDQARSIAA